MFQATDWELDEPEVEDSSKYDLLFPTLVRAKSQRTNAYPEMGIAKVFPFESRLQRMSVITKALKGGNASLVRMGARFSELGSISTCCLRFYVGLSSRNVLTRLLIPIGSGIFLTCKTLLLQSFGARILDFLVFHVFVKSFLSEFAGVLRPPRIFHRF